jgi:carnitine O-acetyltransferase
LSDRVIDLLIPPYSKTLSIEMAKGEPMCMDSYKYMFNNCRMPKKPSDYEAIFDPVKNNHVVVIRKNKFYVIDTIHNGKQLSTNELQQQFQRIIDQAGSGKGLPIGVLTSDNRDRWTEVRCHWLFIIAGKKIMGN